MDQSLKFILFQDIVYWDVKRYYSNELLSKYPIVKLENYIKLENHKIKLDEHPDEYFGILGVNNKIGIFDSYKEKGDNINQPYKKMDVGWIAYNPYRVNVGSIGVKYQSHEYKYISPAYVVFSCKKELLPDFLFNLLKTTKFNEIINNNTTGSVRQVLSFDSLKMLSIALPPIDIQKQLLNKCFAKQKKAALQEEDAKGREAEINSFLINYFNISFDKVKKQKGLSIIDYKSVGRWSTDSILNANNIEGLFDKSYPVMKIRDLAVSCQYGLSTKATEDCIGIPILRMNNINNSELEIEDLKYVLSSKEIEEKFLLDRGDILFNRTNSKELVGKTAVFQLKGKYTFASYLIRLKLDVTKVNVDFINFLFNSPIGRIQIDLVSRQVSGQANVNAQELQEMIFPIPELRKQNEIVRELFKIKKEAANLRNLAEENKTNAITDFENEIFEK